MRWLLLPPLVLFAGVALALWRSPIRAVAWQPPAASLLASDPPSEQAASDPWSSLELLPLPQGHGPESVVAGPHGWLYAGLKGGRIVRFHPDGSGMELYADTGGRPNGMAFDAKGNLLVADSYRKELVAVTPDRSVRTLADQADGQPLVFPDGLAIAADGAVWLTDATARFPDGEFHYEVLEGSATGRLLAYDPKTGVLHTEVEGLRFPNGIALGPDDAFLLINETLGYRTLRYWIKGPKAGQTEPLSTVYPGMPDDIRFNGRDRFWIALNARRLAWVDWLEPHPLLKAIVAGSLGQIFPDTDARWIGSGAAVLAIDLDGKVVQVLRDEQRRYVTCTGVLEYQGSLYLGSVVEPSVAKLPAPGVRSGRVTRPPDARPSS